MGISFPYGNVPDCPEGSASAPAGPSPWIQTFFFLNAWPAKAYVSSRTDNAPATKPSLALERERTCRGNRPQSVGKREGLAEQFERTCSLSPVLLFATPRPQKRASATSADRFPHIPITHTALHAAFLTKAPLPFCRRARDYRKNSGIQVAETLLCPESRKTSRGSPTAQGKNWPWKRKLTRCAGSLTAPERKNALPVLHGRSEGDFPNFSRHASGRENADARRNTPEEIFDSPGNSAQAGSTAGRIFRQKVSPLRKAPRTRQEKGKFP